MSTSESVWHIDTEGLELTIRRVESDALEVSLGHENIDDARSTVIIASRLVEMVREIAPEAGAERDALRAERDALAEQVGRVRELHRPTTVEATQGECAAEECAHEDDCPTVPVGVCAECYRIGEDVYPWAYEDGGLQHVEYPCPTIRALDGDGGE